ncbi:TPA: hypothetical protein EYP44_03575 [Candidatus Bathyarchaeota archaeon]|nr:hypothetical protein [Candidatus Bathyarchaeota archaeon]
MQGDSWDGRCSVYYLQQFVPTDDVPDASLRDVTPPSRELLIRLGKIALDEGVENVYVKTREHGLERVKS